jgi:purine-nucleoside phosphorylase
MGMPSIGIYSYELFNFFEVENIIRIGSVGGVADSVALRDIIIGMGACTDSNFQEQFCIRGHFAPIASYDLLSRTVTEAEKIGVRYHVGNILSTDVFYNADPEHVKKWAQMGILGVEMEAAALYMNAAVAKKNAIAVCTVSDHIIRGESLDSDARQSSFTDMMKIARNVAASI